MLLPINCGLVAMTAAVTNSTLYMQSLWRLQKPKQIEYIVMSSCRLTVSLKRGFSKEEQAEPGPSKVTETE